MRCHASVYLTVRDALLNTKIRMKYERQQYRAIAIPQKKKKNEMKMKNVTLHMQSRLPIRQNDLLFSIYEFFYSIFNCGAVRARNLHHHIH